MNNEKMFEVATRRKMRFPFKGMVSVEDLWDLSPKELDQVFKSLNSKAKKVKEESLLDVKTKANEELDTQIEIVKYIVNVKLDEENVRAKAKENKEQKQKIMKIIAEKQDADLYGKSVDELSAMLNEIE